MEVSSLLAFLRFLYTGRVGPLCPLTALDMLHLTAGDDDPAGKCCVYLLRVHASEFGAESFAAVESRRARGWQMVIACRANCLGK